MPRKHLYLSAMLLLALIAPPAFAQDDTTTTNEASVVTTSEQAEQTNTTTDETAADTTTVDETATEDTTATDSAVEYTASEEATQDETVTEEDLGAKTPGRFHFLKKAARTIQRTITFDPVKKAELRIEEANEELLHARQIVQNNPDDAKAQEKAADAVEKFQRQIEKIKDNAESIKENRPEQSDAFMQKVADMQIKQQKMLDNLEERVPEAIFIRIKENREKAIQHFGDTMTRATDDPKKIAENINTALAGQRGSDFREFKNLEVLGRIHEFIPEQARAAIEQAQTDARTRFEAHISQLPEEARAVAFKNYVQNVNGDPIQQMKVLGDIKSKADLPQDFFKHVEVAREHAMNKFEERFRSFGDPANREKFIDNLASGNMEDLRVLQEMQSNMPEDVKAEIKQKEEQSIQRFKEKFTDNPDAQARAEQFRQLGAKVRENPDPATFALIQKLEAEMPPEQKAFIQELKQEASQGFEEQFRREQSKFMERIQSFDPNSIQHLQQFQAQVPPEVQLMIDQAINQQVDFSFESLEGFDNPASFERFKQKFTESPELKQKIESRHGNFDFQLEQKDGEIEQVRQRIEAEFNQKFEGQNIPPQELEQLKQRQFLRPQSQNAEEFRQLIQETQQNGGQFPNEFNPSPFEPNQPFPGQQNNNNGQGFDPSQVPPGDRGEFRSNQVQDRNEQGFEQRFNRQPGEQFNPSAQGNNASDEARQRLEAQNQKAEQKNSQNSVPNNQPKPENRADEFRQSTPEPRPDAQNIRQELRQPNQQQGQQQQPQQQQNFQPQRESTQPQGGFNQPSSPSSGGGSFAPPPAPSGDGSGSFSPPPQ